MRAFRRPPGYYAYVALGLAGVVAATIASAAANADDPGSRTPLYVGVGAVAVFMVGLLVLQWIGIALAARDAGPAETAGGPGDPPADLLVGLALEDGAGRRSRAARRNIMGGAVRQQALVTAMTLAVVGGGIAWVLGVDDVWRPFGEEGMGFPLAFAPVFAVLAFALLTLPLKLRWAVSASDDLYRPLGLQIVSLPALVILPGITDPTKLVGATVIGGSRHDRRVEVVLDGRHHTVALEGPFPAFSVRGGSAGRLDARDGTPAAVASRLAAITPDRRWRNVELDAGGDGLVIRRSGGGSSARERWLDDLWLAETCAAAARA